MKWLQQDFTQVHDLKGTFSQTVHRYFDWTKSSAVPTNSNEFTFAERFDIETAAGRIFLAPEDKDTTAVEHFDIDTLRNIWLAAYSDTVRMKDIENNSYMSAVFLRLMRAKQFYSESGFTHVTLKNEDADSRQQSVAAANAQPA